MNIARHQSAIRVGSVHVGTRLKKSKGYIRYPTGLVMEWDDQFPKELRRRHLGIVYFLCVDGEIKKIGQTSAKSGIKSCMDFYFNAGSDDPSDTRFAINYLMREEIAKGRLVEVYIQYEEPLQVMTKGITSSTMMEVAISPKAMEQLCQEDFVASEGRFPEWNFQEAGLALPAPIPEIFAEYKVLRQQGRTA